ncbi:universal stress protein [Halobellus sp. Atlit-31R]|nr:universal stress protein [Halobellus sp. Atlit-31R]
MYRVLIPVDDDENRALNQARYAAHLPDSASDVEATVLYVASKRRDIDETDFEAAGSAVAAADYLDSRDVAVDRRIEAGGVSETVLDVAEELDADELVMGGRKRSGVAQALLGSTVRDVFVSTERPVTITGAEMVVEGGAREVLVPVDSNRERTRHQVEYVTGLPNAAEHVTATVLYVFPHQDYRGAPAHEFDDVEAAVETAGSLEEAGVSVERATVGGEVARKILDTAEDRSVDSIVMGGRKRSGVQKALLGSIAQDVMLSADRPVTLTG